MPERDHRDHVSSPESIEPLEPPELQDLRRLAEEEFEFLDHDRLAALSTREQLALLQEYWNQPASFEHFAELIERYGKGGGDALHDVARVDPHAISPILRIPFTTYLLHKLPVDLRERWEGELETGTKTIEQLIHAVSRLDAGLILGFHVSPRDITGDEIRIIPSSDVFSGTMSDVVERAERGPIAADTSTKSWYSLDPHHLYGQKEARYVYLVEGSRGDLATARQYQHGQVFTRQSLRIRARVPLTGGVIRSLDVRFGQRGTI